MASGPSECSRPTPLNTAARWDFMTCFTAAISSTITEACLTDREGPVSGNPEYLNLILVIWTFF